MSITYGYVRVSSRDQNIDRQMIAMHEQGIQDSKIYVDKLTGKDFNRPKYKQLLRKVKAGDILFVKSIDRLGRNYEEIMEQWKLLTKQKGVDIVVIDLPLLDTRNQINGITGTFISDMVLQVLSYVAQIERENIHQRQMEGIRAAKLKGIRFGRPKKEKPANFVEVFHLWEKGEISMREAARRTGVTHHTFSDWIKESTNAKNPFA